jgi:enoyl-CoA hydratase
MPVIPDNLKEIKVEKREGVLSVTLNRSEESNPTAWTLLAELNNVWNSIHDDSDVRAVVFSGAGPDFSTVRPGVVIHPVLKYPDHPLRNFEYAGPEIHGDRPDHISSLKSLLGVPQPIVAAIHGLCTGFATTLALSCDVVIAADNLQISDPHIIKGMAPGDGGAVIWPLLVGPNRAKEYLLTGDSLSGAEAERIGLVNRVVPLAELQNTAWALAKRLADGSPLATRLTKHAVNRVIQHALAINWELADAYQVLTTLTEDTQEARRAIAEKRPPHYSGR